MLDKVVPSLETKDVCVFCVCVRIWLYACMHARVRARAFLLVPVALVVAFIICEDMKLTCVLYVAWTLRLILSISRIVSSFPWRISNSFHVCQNVAVI